MMLMVLLGMKIRFESETLNVEVSLDDILCSCFRGVSVGDRFRLFDDKMGVRG